MQTNFVRNILRISLSSQLKFVSRDTISLPIKALRKRSLCSVSEKLKYCNSKQLGTPVTMKLDSPDFHSLFTPELKCLIELFEKNNFELRIAGGAVRDLVLRKDVGDIDFATTATPTQMKEMFELAGIRMINNKGESHGTITARINDKENFEVTTLRIDIRTDGRHAEVEFTKDWQLDANRRDLTINSMFLGFDGTVFDYFNGLEDLKNKRVRFVGNPEDRIVEDYLRILRYFRFFGRIASNPDAHDDETLKAIRENGNGLAGIAGERIWMELKKILVGNFADSIVKVMADTGITKYLGLPESINVEELQLVYEKVKDLDPHPMTLMAALLNSEEEVYKLNERLKVSNEELKTCIFIIQLRDSEEDTSDLENYYKKLAAGSAGQDKKVVAKVIELLKYKGHKHLLPVFLDWQMPRLPVGGVDLMERQVKKGPKLAKLLNRLRALWIESNFQLTKEELLDRVDEILEEIGCTK